MPKFNVAVQKMVVLSQEIIVEADSKEDIECNINFIIEQIDHKYDIDDWDFNYSELDLDGINEAEAETDEVDYYANTNSWSDEQINPTDEPYQQLCSLVEQMNNRINARNEEHVDKNIPELTTEFIEERLKLCTEQQVECIIENLKFIMKKLENL